MPTLPLADEAAERLADELCRWAETGAGAPPRIRLGGEAGSGKSHVLQQLAKHVAAKATPLLMAPPTPDFDAPLHAIVQGAAALRGAGVNGVLDPAFSLGSAFRDKVGAVVAGVRERRCVVLIDLPRFDAPGLDARSPEVQHPRKATEDLVARLASETADSIALVVATRDPPTNEAVGWRAETVESSSVAGSLDPENWGRLADSADLLRSFLGIGAVDLSPLGLRLAVALVALGRPAKWVASTCRLGMNAIRNAFRTELRDREVFARALRYLRVPRVPIALGVVETLIRRADAVAFRVVLDDALIMEDDGGRILHPAIRELLPPPHAGTAMDERDELASLHRFLRSRFSPHAALDSRDAAISRLEFVHHAACGGEADEVMKYALDGMELVELGRALSFQERYREAAEVFGRAFELTGSDYARHYRAFNRERDRGADADVEDDYAATMQNEPSNPWWNRRYIVSLLARGKVEEARAEFAAARKRFVSPDTAWLARNFHAGVARAFLERSHLEDAEQVLETIPADFTNDELDALWNELKHRRESRLLGGAVFPLSVPFDRRWLDGPHLATESERASCLAWFPGRVTTRDDDVITVDFCEKPEPGEPPALLRKHIPLEAFDEVSPVRAAELRPGTFIEILELPNETTRVKVYPATTRALPFTVNHLRGFRVTSTPEAHA